MTRLTKSQLIEHFKKGEKPKSQWLIGTEHEIFLYDALKNTRLPYEGERGIKAVLQSFLKEKWSPVFEGETLIGARHKENFASLSLEPGGQFELSGAPLATLHDTALELKSYYTSLTTICDALHIHKKAIGFDSYTKREDVPWMPKKRYDIMKAYMPQKGRLGLDMMLRTCTVQVNLDYQDEQDMVDKFRLSMALQPLVVALFANSPLTEGRPNGFQSYRSYIWQETDPDRCGFLDFVFDKNMGYERYTDYLLTVPMYFIYRNKNYINTAGASFEAFMRGELQNETLHPTLQDWIDHTSVAFPEVRLKQYLELRGADTGSFPMLMALPAFWVGLLYDEDSRNQALSLISEWSVESMIDLYKQAPYGGIRAILNGQSVADHLNFFLNLSFNGLKTRNKKNLTGQDESFYLSPLFDILKQGQTCADRLLTENGF